MIDSVMVDLETMGNSSRAAIISVGAFAFDSAAVQTREAVDQKQLFSSNVSLQSSMKAGLEVDASTVEWWMRQSDAARNGLVGGKVDLESALRFFSLWFQEFKTINKVWGNGATFDNVILRNAFKAIGLDCPWTYQQDYCFRTVKNLYGKLIPFERYGVHHNAVDDAITQGLNLQKILSSIGKVSV